MLWYLLVGCCDDCLCACCMHKIGVCALCLVHSEYSASLSARGFIMRVSFPSFSDVESETQKFENPSNAVEPVAKLRLGSHLPDSQAGAPPTQHVDKCQVLGAVWN